MLFWRRRGGTNQINLTKCEVDMTLKCRRLQLGCFACGCSQRDLDKSQHGPGMMEISSCGSWTSDPGDTDRPPSVGQRAVSPRVTLTPLLVTSQPQEQGCEWVRAIVTFLASQLSPQPEPILNGPPVRL